MALASVIAGIVEGAVNSGYGIYNSERNYWQQKEQFDYQKRLQQQIFDREDNAVQRRVADLKQAGLSPVLATGSSAGSGGIVSTSAPQASTPEVSTGIQQAIDAYYSVKSKQQDIKNQKEQGDVLKKQGELLSAQEEYYRTQSLKGMQETSNLVTSNATQQFQLDVDKQEFNDYLYNREKDVRAGKKITKGYSGGVTGLAEQFSDRSDSLNRSVKSDVGNFLHRAGERIKSGWRSIKDNAKKNMKNRKPVEFSVPSANIFRNR